MSSKGYVGNRQVVINDDDKNGAEKIVLELTPLLRAIVRTHGENTGEPAFVVNLRDIIYQHAGMCIADDENAIRNKRLGLTKERRAFLDKEIAKLEKKIVEDTLKGKPVGDDVKKLAAYRKERYGR